MLPKTLRQYGEKPYRIVVVHGGPGAPGELALLAHELGRSAGVLEPLQSEDSVDGQVDELHEIIDKTGCVPVILIGWSWGAWLSLITAARFPEDVKKLILVGSPPFEDSYAEMIMKTRLDRLDEHQKCVVAEYQRVLDDLTAPDKDEILKRFAAIMATADTYDPISSEDSVIECQSDTYIKVWSEAKRLRSSGELIDMAGVIRCPVIAIHGDYDPHPAEGVRRPLLRAVQDFRFILLENCGHRPWLERQARDSFYCILEQELASGDGR